MKIITKASTLQLPDIEGNQIVIIDEYGFIYDFKTDAYLGVADENVLKRIEEIKGGIYENDNGERSESEI